MNATSDNKKLSEILSSVDGLTKSGSDSWNGRCPAHADSSPSLSITLSQDDDHNTMVLLHCFAGCSFTDICEHLNLEKRHLFNVEVDDPEVSPRVGGAARSADKLTDEDLRSLYSRVERAQQYRGDDLVPELQERVGLSQGDYEAWLIGVEGELVLFPAMDVRGNIKGLRIRDFHPGAQVKERSLATPDTSEASWLPYTYVRPDNCTHDELVVTEGPIDGLTASVCGYDVFSVFGTANASNALVQRDLLHAAKGRVVVVCGDADNAGRKFSSEISRYLSQNGFVVRVVEPPREKWDLNDWYQVNRDAFPDEFRSSIESTESVQPSREPAVIRQAGPTPQKDIAEAVVHHALELNIYRQGQKPVVLLSSDQREGTITEIENLTGEVAAALLGEVADIRSGKDDLQTDHLQASLVGPALKRRELKSLPRLEAVLTRPVLLPNGDVIHVEGYHAEECVYFAPVRPNPGLMSKDDAVKVIQSVTSGFPFKTEGDRARFIGALLLPAVRDYASGRLGGELNMPGVVITAASPATGKSYAAALLSIANGGRWVVQTGSKESGAKEDRNAITSLLLAGNPVIVFDNVKTNSGFGGAVFDSLLTSPTWSDRLLGGNTNVELLNDRLWVWTGNNVYPNGDTAERVIHVRLDSNDPDPGSRPPESFEVGDMAEFFKSVSNRDLVFSAVLSLAKGWHDAGAVLDESIAWRQYSGICRVVGGIMTWAGLGKFEPTEGRIEVDSVEGEDEWEEFFAAMHESAKSWSPKELAEGIGTPARLYQACEDVFRPSEGYDKPTAKHVGNVLSGRLDSVIGDLKLVKAQNANRQWRNWQVINRHELDS